MLQAPLRRCAPRLALEVDQNEIITPQENLPEVIVAVAAGLEPLRYACRRSLDPTEQ
jgi:hypothetical protein